MNKSVEVSCSIKNKKNKEWISKEENDIDNITSLFQT